MEENWYARKPGDAANKNITTREAEIKNNIVFRAIRNSGNSTIFITVMAAIAYKTVQTSTTKIDRNNRITLKYEYNNTL